MATKIDNDARKVESPLEARRARARPDADAPKAPQAARPATTQVSISERARNLARTEQTQRNSEAAQTRARETSDTYERLQVAARRARAENEVKRAE